MIKAEDVENFAPMSSGWHDRESSNDITAMEYLDFASRDIQDGNTNRYNINALSNAKRALHLCVEDLAEALGAYQGECTPHAPFPRKLDFCRRCGIASPRIIEKINKMRNKVEHEYYVPTRDEVEDFVDIVTLFIHSTRRLISGFPTNAEIGSTIELFGMNISWLGMEYAIGSGKLELRWHHLEATEEDLRRKREQVAGLNEPTNEDSRRSEGELYREASSGFWRTEAVTITVRDKDKYFEWM
jgi:hypothetical protein